MLDGHTAAMMDVPDYAAGFYAAERCYHRHGILPPRSGHARGTAEHEIWWKGYDDGWKKAKQDALNAPGDYARNTTPGG